jgi:DNA-directed RNA polymerase subunit RPC12/RpoP
MMHKNPAVLKSHEVQEFCPRCRYRATWAMRHNTCPNCGYEGITWVKWNGESWVAMTTDEMGEFANKYNLPTYSELEIAANPQDTKAYHLLRLVTDKNLASFDAAYAYLADNKVDLITSVVILKKIFDVTDEQISLYMKDLYEGVGVHVGTSIQRRQVVAANPQGTERPRYIFSLASRAIRDIVSPVTGEILARAGETATKELFDAMYDLGLERRFYLTCFVDGDDEMQMDYSDTIHIHKNPMGSFDTRVLNILVNTFNVSSVSPFYHQAERDLPKIRKVYTDIQELFPSDKYYWAVLKDFVFKGRRIFSRHSTVAPLTVAVFQYVLSASERYPARYMEPRMRTEIFQGNPSRFSGSPDFVTFQCQDCGSQFEAVRSYGENDECERCGSKNIAPKEAVVSGLNKLCLIHKEHDPLGREGRTRVTLCPHHYRQAMDCRMVDKVLGTADEECYFCG